MMSYNVEATLEEMLQNDDWRNVIAYAKNPEDPIGRTVVAEKFNFDDVAEVVASSNGVHDGYSWIALFRLKDGRFLYVDAGCCYTGWDCNPSGSSSIAPTLGEAVAFCLTEDSRSRLGVDRERDFQTRTKGEAE